MKRVIIAVNAPDDVDINDIATEMNCYFSDADATVYNCAEDFVLDYQEGALQ